MHKPCKINAETSDGYFYPITILNSADLPFCQHLHQSLEQTALLQFTGRQKDSMKQNQVSIGQLLLRLGKDIGWDTLLNSSLKLIQQSTTNTSSPHLGMLGQIPYHFPTAVRKHVLADFYDF